MLHPTRLVMAFSAVAAVALCSASPSFAGGKSCVTKSAQGTGASDKDAKFQVDEALLQAVDWGAWASWMAGNGTPGYSFGARKYKCGAGGIGVQCVGTATICKL